MKLSKPQADLLVALQGGGTLLYMAYMGRFNPTPYYSCFDLPTGSRRCTKAAEALLKRELIKRIPSERYNDYRFQLTPAGREWKPEVLK